MKHRINLTVDKENYEILSAAGINISRLVNETLGKEARKIKAEQWKAENRAGMQEIADFIAQHGSFADENREW